MGHNCWSPCAVEPVLCNKRSRHTATRDKLPLSTTREKQRKPHTASPQKKRELGDKLGALRLRYTYCCCYAAKSLRSCPTLCDPIDGSPPGSPIPGILQARTLEWVAISFSNAWKWKVKVKSLSRVWVLATPWTATYQAPPSMGFSKQEHWSGVPLPSPYTLLYIK